jgi:PhnB protein
MKLHTYLNYGGNSARAFRFYEKHLGGKISMMMTQGEQPNAKDVPPDQKDAILYARMTIGETDLMGSDVPFGTFSANAQRLSLSLSVNTTDEAERFLLSYPMAAKPLCRCRRRSSLTALPCCATSLGRLG